MQTSCPHCGQVFDVSPELLGTQVQCSACAKPFNIPAAPAGSQAASAAATQASTQAASQGAGQVEVACPHCESRFNAPQALIGTQVNCPSCQGVFTVAAAEPDELRLAPPDDNDPFGGLPSDPLGATTSPLGASGLNRPATSGGGRSPARRRSSDSDQSGLWIGVAKILGGILMGIFGVVATMASYEAAAEGESYTMYHGLVIGGIALFFFGCRDIYVSTQG